MKKKIGIIALDLDGTLLDSNKQLSAVNEAALAKAAAAGIEIVPTTGRFFGAMPAFIRNLPFINYAITINGAEAVDVHSGEVLYKAELPWEQAVSLVEFLENRPLITDCYMGNQAYMSAANKEKIDEMAPDEHYVKMLRELRQPVDDLKALIREKKQGVQKVQFFTKDLPMRQQLLKEITEKFEHLSVSSSIWNNVEINEEHANKGEALAALARHLGLPEDATIAFGDGMNDLSMLKSAGIGIAMANACPEAKAIADWETVSNDENGVAVGIEKFCFEE